MRKLALIALFPAAVACGPRASGGDGGTDGGDDTNTSTCKSTASSASGKCELALLSPLPAPRTATTALVSGDHVYVIGGQSSGGVFSSEITASKAASNGALGGWGTAGGLPDLRANPALTFAGERLYSFGGELKGTVDGTKDAFVAVRGADGGIGAFTKTKDLDAPRTFMSAAGTPTAIYLIGGRAALGANDDASVTIARLDSEGNITAYEPGPALPLPRSKASVAIVGNRLYVVGGNFLNNDKACARDTVLFSTISADGSLSAWTATTSLPKQPAGAYLAASDDRLFIVGGIVSYGDPGASVLAAGLNADGSLDAWERIAYLKDMRYGQSAAYVNGRLFAFGGLVENTVLADVVGASITGSGTAACP